jgi:hypothetical protein
MKCRSRYLRYLSICLAAASLGLTAPARADLLFQVQVDTTAIMNTPGYFDLQFNPASVGATAATATITNFVTDGMFLSDPNNTTDGDVTGSLASTLTINNTDTLNDLLQAINYGTTISFNLDISGPATTTPDPNNLGSAFALSLYDSNFNPLLTTDPNGSVATILLNPDTTITTQTFPASAGSGPAATVQFFGSTTVPEPSSIVIGGIALAMLACHGAVRRISRSRAKRSAPR